MLNNTANTTTNLDVITLSSGSITLNGTGPQNAAGISGNSGAFLFAPYSTVYSGTIAAPVYLQSSVQAPSVSIVVGNGSSTGELSITSNISGPGGLTKDWVSGLVAGRASESTYWANSQGILYLAPTGSNTYQGNTTINAGTILLGSPTALPSTTVLSIDGSNGSTLDLGGQSVAVAGLYNGTLTNSGGTITNSGGSLATLTITGNGLFSGTIQDGISQTALAINSTGVVTLGGTNTNTGGMTVNTGTLQLASASAAQSNTVTVNVNNGLTFNTSHGSVTTFNVAGLGGSGNVILADSSGAYNVTLNVGGNGASSNYNGQLSGGGGLTKSGNGTLTLGGAISYTGSTSVNRRLAQYQWHRHRERSDECQQRRDAQRQYHRQHEPRHRQQWRGLGRQRCR